jgi:hypothetical protein
MRCRVDVEVSDLSRIALVRRGEEHGQLAPRLTHDSLEPASSCLAFCLLTFQMQSMNALL